MARYSSKLLVAIVLIISSGVFARVIKTDSIEPSDTTANTLSVEGVTTFDDSVIVNGALSLDGTGPLTTNGSAIVGDSLSGSSISITNTTQSSTPCPVMTRAEMEVIATPANGSCVFNSTDNAQYNYDLALTEWVIAGSVVNVENISDWINDGTITITSTGTSPTKGSSSIDNIKYRRVGDSMEVSMSYRASGNGNGTGFYLFEVPAGLSIDTSKAILGNITSNVIQTGTRLGTGEMRNSNSFGAHTSVYAYDATRVYMIMGAGVDAAGGGSHPYTGDIYGMPTGMYGDTGFTANYTVPIVGWESSLKYASTTCEGLSCFNEFSSKVSDSGIVSDENLDFLNGSCVQVSNVFTCTFATSLFSAAPNCSATPSLGGRIASVNSVTASQVVISTLTDAGGPDNQNFILQCQRAGADFFDHDERFIPINDQENVYSAYVDYQGTVQSESSDFIEGNCPITAASQYTCTYKASFVLAQAMSCVTTSEDASEFHSVLASTSTYVSSKGINDGGNAATSGFYIVCQKQGADYNEPKAYVGNLNPKTLVETQGSNKPKMYSAHMSGSGVVSQEIGSFINGNCTNARPSVCTFETGAFTTDNVNCVVNSHSNDLNNCIANDASSTSVLIFCITSSTGGDTTQTTEKDLICHGE